MLAMSVPYFMMIYQKLFETVVAIAISIFIIMLVLNRTSEQVFLPLVKNKQN